MNLVELAFAEVCANFHRTEAATQTQPVSRAIRLGRFTKPSVDQWPKATMSGRFCDRGSQTRASDLLALHLQPQSFQSPLPLAPCKIECA